MENKDSGPSLFETIGFKYNDCLMVLDVLKLVGTDMPDDCKNPEVIIRKFIKQGYLGISDAVSFTIYFGIPKNPEDQLKWDKMEQGYRAATVMNLITKSGITSFTKLLWSFFVDIDE